MTTEPVMRAHGVSKVYGATTALRTVDFAVRPASVTTLFGENGAGKSTLMKILAGIERPTIGWLELDGEPVEFSSPRDASDRGISIIHQELSLCPNLSLCDNLFLGRELRSTPFTVDKARQHERAGALLQQLEEPLDPASAVGELRLGQQQLVEIARALLAEARILIMDEPTSALSSPEVEVLFTRIRELTASGVGVVYISHHLEEALAIADHVVVLRDGAVVGQAEAGDIDARWVVERMVGRDPEALFTSVNHQRGSPLLQASDLVVADPVQPRRRIVDGVSITLHAGEVVGIYGLMGSGRTELLEALAGRVPLARGEITLRGEPLGNASISTRIERGLTLVPEDRQRDGLVPPMSVSQNLSLSGLRRYVTHGWLARNREATAVNQVIADVTVKTSRPDAPITSLSGGNQQKVVIGKALLTDPHVLLLDEPTRGIDVAAKADIFEIMARQATDGRGVLFATSEVEEALNIPHRLIVMAKGRVVGQFRRGEITQERLKALAEGTSTQHVRGSG